MRSVCKITDLVFLHQRRRFFRISIMDEKILFEKIMLRIRTEQKRMALKRKIAGFSVILAISFAGLIPAVKAIHSGFVNSGFTQIFSLMFSDTAIVIGSWQNFALSLLETLPINGILITGIFALVFFSSLRFLSNNLKNYGYKQNISIKLI